MKNLHYAFGILAIFSMPVHAADMCREEAKAMGYVSALEMLAPCEQKVTATTEQSRNERQQTELKSTPESQAIAKVDANVAR